MEGFTLATLKVQCKEFLTKTIDITKQIIPFDQLSSVNLMNIVIHNLKADEVLGKKWNEPFLLLYFIQKYELQKICNNCPSSFTHLVWFINLTHKLV